MTRFWHSNWLLYSICETIPPRSKKSKKQNNNHEKYQYISSNPSKPATGFITDSDQDTKNGPLDENGPRKTI